ncbi:hypothetical protein [Dokdonia sinensis]|nr:hypothetical protein [Dokdonia sinensis]
MRILLFLCATFLATSCETGKKTPALEYKYADKEQSINCTGQKNALLNEALYSFEQDITRNYDPETQRTTVAYARFIVPGLSGTAEFNRLPSDHSKAILEKLKEEKIIVMNLEGKSNLNYDHPAVTCLLDNLEDGAIMKTLKALIETGSMDPKLMDTRMRNKGRDLDRQRNLALYVALDAYYQNLANIDWDAIPSETTTE